MPSYQQHLDAMVLAFASSTDNFTVGLSLGMQKTTHYYDDYFFWTNVIIAICNALGAWMASHGGILVSHHLQYTMMAPLLASLAFGVLAIQEFRQGLQPTQPTETSESNNNNNKDQHDNQENNQNSSSSSSRRNFLQKTTALAIPMTLNNLAGGVAGGAAG